MQLRIVSLAVLLVGADAVRRFGASEARAEAWMRDNPDADQAGLDDLKNSDPNSYAIVQALLMKQQAGLLDAANPMGKSSEGHESAADIMRDAPTIEGAEGAMSEIAIKAPVQHAVFTHGNPWAFKPHNDDDAMVSSVLGAASELTGSSMPSAPSMPSSSLLSSRSQYSMPSAPSMPAAPSMQYHPQEPPTPYHPQESLISAQHAPESALNADMDLVAMAGSASDLGSPASSQQSQVSGNNYYGISMDWGKKNAAPVASMSQQNSYVAPAQPAPPAMNRANPYLDGIDFGNQQAAKPAASLVKQGSYLESINFPGTAVQGAQAPASKAGNDLMGFSWGDLSGVASGAVKVNRPVETQYVQVVEDKVAESKLKGALSDWLSPEDEPQKPVAHRHQQQQPDEQPGDNVDPMAIDKYNDWAHSGVFQ